MNEVLGSRGFLPLFPEAGSDVEGTSRGTRLLFLSVITEREVLPSFCSGIEEICSVNKILLYINDLFVRLEAWLLSSSCAAWPAIESDVTCPKQLPDVGIEVLLEKEARLRSVV